MLSPSEIEFVQSNLQADVSALALLLRRFNYLNTNLILKQIEGYQAIEHKVPTWFSRPDLLFPQSLSIEQCSSEATARYKAQIIRCLGNIQSMADLTGGFGVDCAFLGRKMVRVLYVERQAELCELVRHNFRVLGLSQIEVKQGDGLTVLSAYAALSEKPFDLIFLDPARRDHNGGKVVSISDCEPDLTKIKDVLLSKARYVLVKLSPMLDISLALNLLPETESVHVVSVDGECKELLFLLKANVQYPTVNLASGSETISCETIPDIHCVNLRTSGRDEIFVFKKSTEQKADCLYAEAPGVYLYEPNASLLKAGAFSILTQAFDIRKLHPNSHLYTSEQLCPDFPGRTFLVESFFPFHSKEWNSHLENVQKANITVRNFPNTVAEIRKKTGLKDGGEVYLFATTLRNEKKVLIRCRKP